MVDMDRDFEIKRDRGDVSKGQGKSGKTKTDVNEGVVAQQPFPTQSDRSHAADTVLPKRVRNGWGWGG